MIYGLRTFTLTLTLLDSENAQRLQLNPFTAGKCVPGHYSYIYVTNASGILCYHVRASIVAIAPPESLLRLLIRQAHERQALCMVVASCVYFQTTFKEHF